MWNLNVTGYESYLKDYVSIFRLKTSGVFVSADVLTLMGWGRVVLVVADYCAQRMVGQYLLPVTIGLSAHIVWCGIFPHTVVFFDDLKVKRSKESGGWYIGGPRTYQWKFIFPLNISGAVRSLIGSDENMLAINYFVSILASWTLVPLCPPSSEFLALVDVFLIFIEEDTVVNSVWRGGRVQGESAV